MNRRPRFFQRRPKPPKDDDTSVGVSATGLRLKLADVGRQFGPSRVLEALDLDVTPGEFVAVVGRSGCGKSTLLRLIAGLDAPSEGMIMADGQSLTAGRGATRLMFQNARLLPWKRVIDNVGLGLSGNWYEKARHALAEVGLADKADAWPAKLSGGQQQRVALARALIHEPRLLLLDEPLGALDALTRLEMQSLIERLWREHGFTVVLVTHDVPEAVQLADRVIVLEQGRIGMDLAIDVARPREHRDPRLGALESRVLDRVLGRTDTGAAHTRHEASAKTRGSRVYQISARRNAEPLIVRQPTGQRERA